MHALLLLNLIIPFAMILVGYILKKHPVSTMKSHNGYNTPTSRKSQKHWDYAQRIAPGIFLHHGKIVGIIEIVLSLVMFFMHVNIDTAVTIGTCVGFGFILLSFYITDTEIEENVER